ncbi:tetratricopeptide repeat protein [Nannocystis pusilla]|uniref:tetratricopeptide repeat protein n=1 Tax=Nannocystis pusilla TaxID=889268 RepID=UPI003DA50860
MYEAAVTPTVCHTNDGVFVLGLPLHHNWGRGSRILISQEQERIGLRTVAVAWVVEQLGTAAKINVIFQRQGQSVEGGKASVPEDGKRLRFDNFYARMESRAGDRVILDLGESDGVSVGDLYEARDVERPDYPVGLVRVTRVHDMNADAVVEGEDEMLGGQHEFVLRPKTLPPPIHVAVVPVRTEGAGSSVPEGIKREGQESLAGTLRRARDTTHDVELQVEELSPEPSGDPKTLLARLAARARARGASQVIWASGSCAAEPCPPVQYAVVPEDSKETLVPKPLLLPSMMGQAASNDMSALLGQIASAGQAFEEASYRLRAWAGSQGGKLDDDMLLQLVEAELWLGQLGRAGIWMSELEGSYGPTAKPLSYYRTRVRIACSNENLSELEALIHASLRFPELDKAQLDAIECAIGLNLKAGKYATVDELLERGRALASSLGDADSLSRLAEWRAELYDRSGKLDEGQQEMSLQYAKAVAAGDTQRQASSSLKLAKNRSRSGDIDLALEHLQKAGDLYKEMRDESGFVECLPLFGQLWRSRYGIEATRKRLSAERAALKGRSWRRVELGLRIREAELDLHSGRLERVRKELSQLLSTARKKQYDDEELQILGLQVEQALITGPMQQGRKALEQYTQRALDLRREPELAHANLLWGRFALQQGDSKLATAHAQKAVDEHRSLGEEAGRAAGELLLGDANRELGRREAAQRHYRAAAHAYQKMRDDTGFHLAKLGLLGLALGEGRVGDTLRSELQATATYFKRSGQPHEHLRATLQSEWATFLAARDYAATLRKLKDLRTQARKNGFAALRAAAQMFIACVDRSDGAYVLARREYELARELYDAMGRYEHSFDCPGSRAGDSAADEGQDARP